eukprot:634613_1
MNSLSSKSMLLQSSIADNKLHTSLHTCDSGTHISQCKAVQRVVSITNNHSLDKEHVIREIRSILDDFLHLLHHHDTPMDFEYIHSLLTNHRCSITTCSIFRRHYRRRSSNVSHEHDITVMRILDRIHCFYQHTYDIGFRYRCSQVQSHTGNTTTNKFATAMDDEHATPHTPYEPMVYSYGVAYEYELNAPYSSSHSNHDYIRYVRNRYSSLKEEICIGMEMVNEWPHELRIAELHYNSHYCKACIHNDDRHQFSIEHVLALMYYCNYDQLQFEFSKTYRRFSAKECNASIAERHSHFYFLGKYIKEAVHYFGSRMKDKQQTFYHGVSKQTVFVSASCAYFHGPLSTSTNYSVAACFADQKGLIVELSDANSIHASPKYFAMHWLSRYSNEHECLFIACQAPLWFANIVSVTTRCEYKYIINALHVLDYVFHGRRLRHALSETDIQMAYGCACHQLEVSAGDADEEQLDLYAQKLIRCYCHNQTNLWLDLDVLRYKIDWVYALFCDPNPHDDWINLERLNDLFTNVESIYVRWNVKLNRNILSKIYEHLQTQADSNTITRIRIAIDKTRSDIEIQTAIDQFEDHFGSIGYVIYARANTDLCIEKSSVYNLPNV